MKKHILNISWLVILMTMFSSCNKFLEENPKTFLSPKFYFKSEAQIEAAVNGIYTFVDDIFDGDIEVGSGTYIFMEYLPGYGFRPLGAGTLDLSQAVNLAVAENNGRLEKMWQTAYTAIENCNSVIEGIESVADGVIGEAKRDKLLGEVYFLRAYNYFNLVRLFGEVPLKTVSTKDLSDVAIPLSSIEDIYTQIEIDLVEADRLMANSPWTSVDGHVTLGAVKTLLAKVYLTMAGYPMEKGTEYYEKAYTEAKAVYSSGSFELFSSYADMRNPGNANSGEYIWMIQREAQYAGSGVHTNMLPYPEPAKPISSNSSFGGALAPTQAFYDSYDAGDLRTEEKGYYYTKHDALDGSGVVQLDRPYIYKYWDDVAASSGKSGANYSLFRYADVLLMMAEAKAQADGGTTTDNDAVEAYYKVRSRAVPADPKPVSIAVNDVLKERVWEMCFEGEAWYDMLRTRKALNVTTKQMVDMIGYQTPGHPEGIKFKESDLLFPYPLRESRLNPNLKR